MSKHFGILSSWLGIFQKDNDDDKDNGSGISASGNSRSRINQSRSNNDNIKKSQNEHKRDGKKNAIMKTKKSSVFNVDTTIMFDRVEGKKKVTTG